MAGSLPYPRQKPLARVAGEVRGIYGEHPLSSFALSKITDTAAAMAEIDVACKFAPSSESPDRVITFRLVYQDQEGSPVIRGKQDAQWIVMNYGWI